MIREGLPTDMDDIFRIRTSVRENHLSIEQMEALGITLESILGDMIAGDLGVWVAEDEGRVVGFSMADRRSGEIFGLFVEEAQEGKGHGTALLAECENWLRRQGHTRAQLNTGRGTKAYDFYLSRGWQLTGEISGHFAEDDIFSKQL